MGHQCNLRFTDQIHKGFYTGRLEMLNPDAFLKSLIYTLGMCQETRIHFDAIYDSKGRCISPDAINEAWQTDISKKVTRLAFQLFSDTTPTAFPGGSHDIDECRRYSVSDIFCCAYAPYFVEAIQLRYLDYLRRNSERRYAYNNEGVF